MYAALASSRGEDDPATGPKQNEILSVVERMCKHRCGLGRLVPSVANEEASSAACSSVSAPHDPAAAPDQDHVLFLVRTCATTAAAAMESCRSVAKGKAAQAARSVSAPRPGPKGSRLPGHRTRRAFCPASCNTTAATSIIPDFVNRRWSVTLELPPSTRQ